MPKREGSIEPREDTRDASTVASTNANSTASTAPKAIPRTEFAWLSTGSLKMRFKTAVRSESTMNAARKITINEAQFAIICEVGFAISSANARTVFSPQPVIPFIFSVKVVMLTLYLSSMEVNGSGISTASLSRL